MVLYLKEHRHVALHVACGDITEVEVSGGNFVITIPDKTVMSMLEDGKREIERALSWQGLELSVTLKEKKEIPSLVAEDEAKLAKMFGKKFKAID